MSDSPTLEELLDVRAFFDLPSADLVEKDFFVTKALAAITTIDTGPLRLIFGGGTALCRAHRLIQRMSEDVDLKIVSDFEPSRPDLRRLRTLISDALLTAGFRFDPNNRAHRDSGNESRYTIFRLPYVSLLHGEGVLRPEIQVEVVVSPLLHSAVDLPLRSFVAEAFDRPSEVLSLACVSITQTVAEKFVALTRRTAAEIADASGPRDATLVRHVYDLHVTRPHYDPVVVMNLVKNIMQLDASVFGNQFP